MCPKGLLFLFLEGSNSIGLTSYLANFLYAAQVDSVLPSWGVFCVGLCFFLVFVFEWLLFYGGSHYHGI